MVDLAFHLKHVSMKLFPKSHLVEDVLDFIHLVNMEAFLQV